MRLLLSLLCMTTLACAQDALVWKQLPALPDALGLAGAVAGVSNGELLVGGGANFPGKMPWEGGTKVWHDQMWVLADPAREWRPAGRLPHALAYSVCVSRNGSIISVGGSDSTKHFAETLRIRWVDGALAFERLPSLPMPLSGACGALVGEVLYIAGGSEVPGEQSATNRAFALDVANEKVVWRELPPLPGKARILAAGASDGRSFYVMGGCALEPKEDGKVSRVYLRDAWRYREADGWSEVAQLPKPSVAAASPAPFVAGRVLLLAGDDGSRVGFQPPEQHPGFSGDILAFDPARNWWSEFGNVPAPRATVPCVEWSGEFIIPSGEKRPGVRSPETWSFRPAMK